MIPRAVVSPSDRRSMKLLLIMLAMLLVPPGAMSQSLGIASQVAPELGVTQWFNLPEGAETIELADYRGKVVYIFCWQKW